MKTPPSPPFDITLCAQQAYLKTWAERSYLLKMAIVPLLIKYILYMMASTYMSLDNVLHVSFIMLPAYLVEGWFLAHWARTVILDHRWPFQPSGNDEKDNMSIARRARGVLAGMVGFTLINFLIAGYFVYFLSLLPEKLDPDNADPKVAIVGFVMMVSTFMLFRYVWSYVPLALNIPLSSFFKAVHKTSVTFSLIGVWIVCFVPAYAGMQLSGNLLQLLQGEGETVSVLQGLDIFIRVVLDSVKNLLTTAAFAYAVIELLKWLKKT